MTQFLFANLFNQNDEIVTLMMKWQIMVESLSVGKSKKIILHSGERKEK